MRIVVAVMTALFVSGYAAGAAPAQGPADKTVSMSFAVAEQPDLKTQLDEAAPLKIEDLGIAARDIVPAGTMVAPHADGKHFNIIQWYWISYRQKNAAYIVDTATGAVKVQKFPETENKVCVGGAFWALPVDGKLFGATPDWSQWETGGAMSIYMFDPEKEEIRLFKQVPGVGGETYRILLGPDGKLYGTGTYCGLDKDKHVRCAAYSLDPKTGEIHNYGPIGPVLGGIAMGYSIGVDDEYIYVACGPIPWHLMAINIKTGEQTDLMQAKEGSYQDHMFVWQHWPGAVAKVEGKAYYLWHAKATPVEVPVPGWRLPPDAKPPWPPMASPWDKYPPRPELFTGQIDPDGEGNATLWYRLSKNEEWKAAKLTGVDTYPVPIHLLANLSDGRIFGTAGGYSGRFLIDPKVGKPTYLGRGGPSIYTAIIYGDKLYFSGYPSGPIWAYDPSKPWTLAKSRTPGTAEEDESDANLNPHRLHAVQSAVYDKTRVKKMEASAMGADGMIYFGGIGQRDYDGGSLAWYDPKTGAIDGIWQPFAEYGVFWLTPSGRYLVIGTRNMPVSRMYIFNTETKKIERELPPPVDKAILTGPMVEIQPGLVIGMTDDTEIKGGGVLYGLSVPAGEIVFRKKVPYGVVFDSQGTAQWDFKMGPDGYIWTILGHTLVRISPKDAAVSAVGKLPSPARFVFAGKDIYLTGSAQARRISGIVKGQ